MHELSIAQSLIEIAEETARNAGATEVLAVHLRLGALSGVVPDALQFSFPIAAEGTLVAGAQLIIEEVPAVVYCDQCAAERSITWPPDFRCPVCGEFAPKLLQGRELQITAIEVMEKDEVDAAAHR
ncbi:MAG: hydrogenase maturation nickel metallochaperone HypA [Anaerolineales bacterium]|nr:hydrogenase maturation nickel metallochaperone HypA [Anaerolineales bacterium]